MLVSIKNVLNKAVKIINFTKSQSLNDFNVCVMMIWKVCIKHFCCILKYDGYSEEKHLRDWDGS